MPTVFVTAPPEHADDIARTLVEERLAACVNRVACDSVYRWEGELHDESEVILLVKTTDDAYDDLLDRIRDLHPYDVPCIERFDESVVLPAYADWRDEAVGTAGDD
jgi:periplasmic divalent cation tolerance protein